MNVMSAPGTKVAVGLNAECGMMDEEWRHGRWSLSIARASSFIINVKEKDLGS
jgi:hypothetical protein